MSANALPHTDIITPAAPRSWLRLLGWCVLTPDRLAAYKAGLDAAGRARLRQTAAWTVNTLLFGPLILLTVYDSTQPQLLARFGQANPSYVGYSWAGSFARAFAANTPLMVLLTVAGLAVVAGLGIYASGRPGPSNWIAIVSLAVIYFLIFFILDFIVAPIFAAPMFDSDAVIRLLGLILGAFVGLAFVISEELAWPTHLLPASFTIGLLTGTGAGVSTLYNFTGRYPNTLLFWLPFLIPLALGLILYYRKKLILRAQERTAS